MEKQTYEIYRAKFDNKSAEYILGFVTQAIILKAWTDEEINNCAQAAQDAILKVK